MMIEPTIGRRVWYWPNGTGGIPVEMRVDWVWSTRHSGAGRHVTYWRLKPRPTTGSLGDER